MRKVWVLDTETKGTGANVVPLEKTQAKPAPKPDPRPLRAKASAPKPTAPHKPSGPVETSRSPLPPGHVRKKETGEIGKVQAVDPKAGTATVFWLKRGSASTVPLAAISRR